MDIEAKIQQSRVRRQRVALLYGAMAGLSFSLVAWGFDAWLLARSHAILPYLQFLIGAIPTMLIGMLAAWLTVRWQNLLISFLAWIAAGMLFARIGTHVSFDLSMQALHTLAPNVAQWVSYPFNNAARGLAFLIFVAIGILSLIAGLLSSNLIQSSSESGTVFGLALPLLIWVVLFAIAGYTIENNYTERFRAGVVGANNLIQFALDHEGQMVDRAQAQQIHLRSAEAIQDVIHRPRRLILARYDDFLSAMTVRVDFDGVPVECSVLDGLVNFCEKIE